MRQEDIAVFGGLGIGDRPLLFLGILLVIVSVQLVSLGLLGELFIRHLEARPLSNYIAEQIGEKNASHL